MSSEGQEVIVQITSAGTISLPKQFRRHMDVQKGDYVKEILSGDGLILERPLFLRLIVFLTKFNRLIGPFPAFF